MLAPWPIAPSFRTVQSMTTKRPFGWLYLNVLCAGSMTRFTVTIRCSPASVVTATGWPGTGGAAASACASDEERTPEDALGGGVCAGAGVGAGGTAGGEGVAASCAWSP